MTRTRIPFFGLTMLASVGVLWMACSTGSSSRDRDDDDSTSGNGAAAGNSSSSSSSGSPGASSSSGGNANSSSGGGNNSSAANNSSASNNNNGSSGSNNNASSSSGGGGSSAFPYDAAGFDPDAGWAPYTGEPEPGVVCDADENPSNGEQVCASDAGITPCSLGLSGAACGTSGFVNFNCDGPEECGAGKVCCYTGFGGANCVIPEECPEDGEGVQGPYRVCTVTADCPAGSGCCYSQTLEEFSSALDVGACIQGCNLSPP